MKIAANDSNHLYEQARGAAARHLMDLGCEIIAVNWPWAGGTVDIVARDGSEIVLAGVTATTEVSAGAEPKMPPEDFEAAASEFAGRYVEPDSGTTLRHDELKVIISLAAGRALINHRKNVLP